MHWLSAHGCSAPNLSFANQRPDHCLILIGYVLSAVHAIGYSVNIGGFLLTVPIIVATIQAQFMQPY